MFWHRFNALMGVTGYLRWSPSLLFTGEVNTVDLQAYIDEIKLKLTGGVIKIELEDKAIASLVSAALREIQRYIDTTSLITIPYKPCMDLSEYHINSVSAVYRSEGYAVADSNADSSAYGDPMYLGMWQMMSGYGNLYNINDWTYNYAAWNTALQTRNTLSTDLAYFFDKQSDKLYVNCGFDRPSKVTIEYVPRFDDVSQVKSDFWIDMIMNLSIALAKVTVGRIRSKYTASNSLWSLDGDTLLTEGNAELTDLRERMKAATNLSYPID